MGKIDDALSWSKRAVSALRSPAPATAAAPSPTSLGPATVPELPGAGQSALRNGAPMSPEAQKFVSSGAGKNPTITPTPPAQPGLGARVMSGVGKVAAPVGVGAGAYNAVSGAMEGDYNKAGIGALDAAASAGLAFPATAIPSATYLGVRGGSGLLSNLLGESGRDKVGGTINNLLQKVGLGVDDTELLQQAPGVTSTPIKPTIPIDSEMGVIDPATVTAPERSNARMGLSVEAQRTADAGPIGGAGALRNNYAPTSDVNVANSNLRASTAGINDNQTLNMGKYGGNADIYASKDANGRLVLTGTGQGSSGYEDSDMYKQGVARAARDKSQLAQIEAQNLRDADARRLTNLESQLSSNPFDPGLKAQVSTLRASEAQRQQLDANAAIKNQENRLAVYKFGAERAEKATELGLREREVTAKERQTGVENTRADQTQAIASDKALTDKLGTILRTTDKDKKDVPDTNMVGFVKEAAYVELGNTVRRLQATPPSDPNYARNQARAKELSIKGPTAMDEKDLNKIIAQSRARQRIQESHSGLNPFGGTFVDSNNPSDFQITERVPGFFQDRFKTKGGSTVGVNDLRYSEGPANAVLPDLKTQTRVFEDAIDKAAQRKNLRD